MSRAYYSWAKFIMKGNILHARDFLLMSVHIENEVLRSWLEVLCGWTGLSIWKISGPTVDLLKQNLHFQQTPRWCAYTKIWEAVNYMPFLPCLPLHSKGHDNVWHLLAAQWEKAMATYSSTLVWKIPWTEGPGGLTSMGSQRVGHNWSDLAAAAAAQWILLDWPLYGL